MCDDGEIMCESGKMTSSMKLTVKKGESKPVIDFPSTLEAPINKPIVFDVPYKVDGTRQTPVEAKLIKDGKVLPLKDVEVIVGEEKVMFKIKKPTREGSGTYQLKIGNGQGEDVKDLNIIMQGKHRSTLVSTLSSSIFRILFIIQTDCNILQTCQRCRWM